jgi:hypothetical protein
VGGFECVGVKLNVMQLCWLYSLFFDFLFVFFNAKTFVRWFAPLLILRSVHFSVIFFGMFNVCGVSFRITAIV